MKKILTLDFIDNSENSKSVRALMGSNYKIIKRSVIMHIPLLPKWVQNKKTKNIEGQT